MMFGTFYEFGFKKLLKSLYYNSSIIYCYINIAKIIFYHNQRSIKCTTSCQIYLFHDI